MTLAVCIVRPGAGWVEPLVVALDELCSLRGARLLDVLTAQVAGSLLGDRRGELVLRAVGGPRDGEIVRLWSPKCSIGSAPWCTLRLVGHGIHDVHCLILRGAARTIARSWSLATRVNGREFTEAELTPGVRLSFGPVAFEVVAAGESPFASTEQEHTDGDNCAIRSDAELQAELERLQSEVNRLQETSVGRLQAHRDDLVALDDETTRREQECTERSAQLDERQRARDQRAGELDDRGQQLDERRANLERWAQELEADRQGFERDRAQLKQQREEFEQQVKTREEVGVAKTEVAFQSVSEDAPVSASDVFSRLGKDMASGEHGATAHLTSAPSSAFRTEMAPVEPQRPSHTTGGMEPAPAVEGDQADESIESYMAKLLERAKGRTSGSTANWQPQRSVPAVLPCSESSGDGGMTSEDGIVAGSEPGPPVRASRPKPSELFSDLPAMRELANLSTQMALDRHARQRMITIIVGKLFVGVIALGVGVAAIAASQGAGLPTYYGGLACILVSAVWFAQFGLLTVRLVRASRKQAEVDQAHKTDEGPTAVEPLESPQLECTEGLRADVEAWGRLTWAAAGLRLLTSVFRRLRKSANTEAEPAEGGCSDAPDDSHQSEA